MNNLINCKNCGAPLHNGKCEYCGSEYEFVPEINSFEQVIELYILGRKRKFYIGSVESMPITNSWRTLDGQIHHTLMGNEIQLNLISYGE